MKVLIISADPEWANVYRWALHTAGFEVSLAGHARTGVQKARSQPPDGILVELELPGKSGIWVLEQLREHGFEYIPVILLTCAFDLPTIQSALDAGARTVLDRGMVNGADVVKALQYALSLPTPK
jgi:DNA-binding response OmpR family regulator